MNVDQVTSLVRAVLLVAGTILVNHGIGDASAWQEITGGALALVPIVWSLFHHGVTVPAKIATAAVTGSAGNA